MKEAEPPSRKLAGKPSIRALKNITMLRRLI